MGRKRRLGSLTLEFAVVVLGVFLALAADSWWKERSDEARAQAYLLALREDMQQARHDLEASAERLSTYEAELAAFLEVIESPQPAPDSTTVPYSDSLDRVFLPLGMIEALMTTGDINLLPPRARTAIIRAYSELESRSDQIERLYDLLFQSFFRDANMPVHQRLAAGEIDSRAEVTGRVIQRDAVLRHAWQTALVVYGNQRHEMDAMIAAVESILMALEDAAVEH